jgi:hypothetical protein
MEVAISKPTSMKKIKPSDLRAEAAAMVRAGTMPSLEALLQAVADTRKKYAKGIRAGRSQSRKAQKQIAGSEA